MRSQGGPDLTGLMPLPEEEVSTQTCTEGQLWGHTGRGQRPHVQGRGLGEPALPTPGFQPPAPGPGDDVICGLRPLLGDLVMAAPWFRTS